MLKEIGRKYHRFATYKCVPVFKKTFFPRKALFLSVRVCAVCAVCGLFHYVCYMAVFKGRVLYVDEKDAMVEYVVKIKQIIKQGNKELQVKKTISFWKRGTCASPDLKVKREYLFMGQG